MHFSVAEIAEIATSIESVLDEVPCSRPDCPGKVTFPDTCKTCSKCRETGRKYRQKKKHPVESGDTIAKVKLAEDEVFNHKNVVASVANVELAPSMLETVPDNDGGCAKPKRAKPKRAKSHICENCGAGHRCRQELATHENTCKAKSKKGRFGTYFCKTCDKSFKKPCHLRTHENGPRCRAKKQKQLPSTC